jgi:hypothetical protein
LKRTFAIACTLGVFLASASASAQDGSAEPSQQAQQSPQATPPFAFGPQPSWQVLFGPTGGASFGSPGAGGFVGAELSFSRLKAGWWLGGYVDGAYDFGQSAAMVTAGPEFGYAFFGVDGGLAAHFDDGGTSLGPQGRLMFSAGLFTLFGRYTYLVEPEEHIGQAGVIFKLPIWADD